MSQPTIREQRRAVALPLQALLGEKLVATAVTLSPDQWDGPTNCPPWRVKTIVAHLVRNAEMFDVMLTTGLAGGERFPQTPEQREERQRELSAMSAALLISTFDSRHRSLQERLARLSASELEQPCPHPRWLMPAWWIVDQRVVELAFHIWDMETSIGRPNDIDGSVAQFMLPAIVENNLPLFYRSDAACAGSWLIRAQDVEQGQWHVRASEGGTHISRDTYAADVTIEGDSAALVRWLYGRAELPDLQTAGRAVIQGDTALAAAWREVFPSP
jgi:uncharacterized protein (TIGR03083 family)